MIKRFGRRFSLTDSPDDSRRIAVDIGGTFTDLVILDSGRVTGSAKVLTTPADPSEGVEAGIHRLLRGRDRDDIAQVVHGTTLISNALIERKGAPTGLITTAGFRDVLTIRNELRYELYDLFIDMPDPLVPRRLRWEVKERILADGSIDTGLEDEDARAIIGKIKRAGVQSLGICLLHSYRNDSHERRLSDLLAKWLPNVSVALSSEVCPELGEYKRTSTTVANAYVLPLIGGYLERMQDRLMRLGIRSPLDIMLSTGGLASVATAKRFPLRLMESGPAAGVLSAGFWAARHGHQDVLAFDMGGTTAKAALVEGDRPLIASEHEAARVYRFTRGSGLSLRVPVIDLIEIGAGGGSIARVGPFGLPKVGPDSSGADPGPACYGLGATQPTVTDADLLLGYLDPSFFLGGEIPLDVEAAEIAMKDLARDLELSIEETASAIHQVVNENMASAARMHAIERGRDLRRYVLVPTGGAGPVHAWGVAKSLGIRSLVFPPWAGMASAFGMLTAPRSFDFVRSLPSVLSSTSWKEVHEAIGMMRREGLNQLHAAGIPEELAKVSITVDVRHLGQGDTVTVSLGDSMAEDPKHEVEESFERSYIRLYGRRPPGVEPEILTWRVKVSGPDPTVSVQGIDASPQDPHTPEPRGSRLAWFVESDGFVETPVYDRYQLLPGQQVEGPALIEERESTAVLGPGCVARVSQVRALEVDVG